ncbi:MAG TPA: alkaline phosphatase family protein, partial [Leptolyngbya sp.]|nr:alkaline phosphatase family protein [Leptolyngbya sp.]
MARFSTIEFGFVALCLVGSLAGCSALQTTNQQSVALPPQSSAATTDDQAIPQYEHIFVIVAENKAYLQVIGKNTPNLTRLATTYGLAKNFYGEVHPSEANYIAMLGGSTFGIHDDDAFYCQAGSSDRFCQSAKKPGYANHTLRDRSLMDQLNEKGLTWKGYFEDLPAADSKAIVAPSLNRALYAAKHNGFMNFKAVQDDPKRASQIVPLTQLAIDLQANTAPNYSHLVLNQCDEMHGLPECPNTKDLIQTGDQRIGKLVDQITQSKLWKAPGNTAIVITWDEDNNPLIKINPQGCCGVEPHSTANFGGGHIATIVVTNHGARGVVDTTPYNHYSLLRTTEDAFGIHEYLNEAGNTAQ